MQRGRTLLTVHFIQRHLKVIPTQTKRVRGQRSNTAAMYSMQCPQLQDGLTLNFLLLSPQTLGHYPSTPWHASEQKRRGEGEGEV